MGANSKIRIVILLFLIEITKLYLTMGCIERERHALLKFKENVVLDLQDMLSSWEGHNCCQWKGVRCNTDTGHVLELHLRPELELEPPTSYSDSKLSGLFATKVDPSLLELKYLNYLDLSGNNFQGSPIPAFFGSLKHLIYLNLSFANFNGRVPYELGNLTKLRVLDLSSQFLHANDFSWASKLSSLQYVDMSGVHLGEAPNLFQVLNTIPSLLQVKLSYCGLTEMQIENSLASVSNTFLSSVQVLELKGNKFENSIPDALQNMTSPIVIDLSLNSITSVPMWFGKHQTLTHLSLAATSIRSIPDAIQNMTSIRFLDLSSNFIDSVPTWMANFRSLEHLNLAYNRLSGSIPDAFQNLTSIRFLDLSFNNLSSVPSWISHLKTLTHLHLGFNALYGPFPDAFHNMTSIRFLSVNQNNLTSSLPHWLGNFNKLVHLDLSNNKLTGIEGTLTSILRNNCELKSLYLSSNNFQGLAFGGYTNFSGCIRYDLEELDLYHNNFSDRLPDWLGHLKNLKYLRLYSNSFFGPIPDSLGELLNLRALLLSDNHLNDTIPIALAQLKNLNELDLSHNDLNGAIPDSLGGFVNLQTLRLSHNHFNGIIPQSLGQLGNLRIIDLSSNSLGGLIPEILAWTQKLNLSFLDLSSNQIRGLLPENISDMMPQLGDLLLEDNLINGLIPESLCTWKALFHLDLSKNQLSGTIPNCWNSNNNIKLYVINLSSNKLSGTIPSSLGSLQLLQWLHLNNNSLHGEIPVALKNCKELLLLDLGENQLSRLIPSWIGDNFSSLKILRLRKNMFSGRIPSNLCKLQALQILDLANNSLSGSIPNCFYNLTNMTLSSHTYYGYSYDGHWDVEDVKQTLKGRELDYTKNLRLVVNMDLSSNNLVGSIPSSLTALSGLLGLNLSHNNFSGGIPTKIGNMKSLESIDFSHNKLSGKIPQSMSALTSLSHLDLSYNNLSGPIPQENQLLTLDNPLNYAGNPYLCGAPLPNKCSSPTENEAPNSGADQDEDGKEDYEKVLFYFVIAVGFATGFWGVIGVLVFKKSWRHAYFQYTEKVMDRMHVAVAIKVAKLKRWMQRNHADE